MRYVIIFAVLAALSGCSKQEETSGVTHSGNDLQQQKSTTEIRKPETARSATKWDGPLGTKMGLTEGDFKAAGVTLKTVSPGVYESALAPSPHTSFETYTYIISPTSGLCKVLAIGKDIKSNVFGEGIKSAYKDMKDPLTEKYGKPSDDYDFLRSGSIWRDSNDWMMSLLKKDRTLASFWKIEGDQNSELKGILLDANGLDTEKGYIALQYSFKNESSCLSDLKKLENSSL